MVNSYVRTKFWRPFVLTSNSNPTELLPFLFVIKMLRLSISGWLYGTQYMTKSRLNYSSTVKGSVAPVLLAEYRILSVRANDIYPQANFATDTGGHTDTIWMIASGRLPSLLIPCSFQSRVCASVRVTKPQNTMVLFTTVSRTYFSSVCVCARERD